MDAAYLAGYEHLYRSHFWWRAREAYLVREIAQLARGGPRRVILDVGCGNGLFFPALQPYGEVYGVEPAHEVLDATGPYRSRIHAGAFDDAYAPPAPVDLLLALDVLEHLSNPGAMLDTARRVLRPGGVMLATVPALRALWTTHDDLNEHVTRFTRTELVSLFTAHGFTVRTARYFFVWLAAAKLLTRGVESAWRRAPRPPSVPPAPLNAVLRLACRLEQSLFAHHDPGFGSSLLLVAAVP